MTDFRTDPVVVLGMHRSGTSLLAGILQENGVDLGNASTASAFNARGNRELLELSMFHERVFERYGASWKEPPSTVVTFSDNELSELKGILEPFCDRELWGFKDPRALWLVEPYLRIFPNARLIGIFRDPASVARSLAARPGRLTLTYNEGVALWRKSNRRLLDVWQRRRFPLVEFSDNLAQSTTFKRPLQRFLAKNAIEQVSTDFFDHNLVSKATGAVAHDAESDGLLNELRQAASE